MTANDAFWFTFYAGIGASLSLGLVVAALLSCYLFFDWIYKKLN
jgi:hypothetical protein